MNIKVTCDKCSTVKTYHQENECFNDGFFYGVNDDNKNIFKDHQILCINCFE